MRCFFNIFSVCSSGLFENALSLSLSLSIYLIVVLSCIGQKEHRFLVVFAFLCECRRDNPTKNGFRSYPICNKHTPCVLPCYTRGRPIDFVSRSGLSRARNRIVAINIMYRACRVIIAHKNIFNVASLARGGVAGIMQ